MNRIPESELILNADGSIYHLAVKAENIADTIITVGDPERVQSVSRHFDEIEFEQHRREFVTHTGTYKGKRLSVMSTGMGTDNIEIFMNELDALASIDLENRTIKAEKRTLNIIRVGTSGSLQKDIEVGSLLATDFSVGLDTLMFFYQLQQSEQENTISDLLQKHAKLPFRPYCVQGSQKLLQQFAFDMVQGNTVTCPGFYAPQGRKLRLELQLPELIDDLNSFRHQELRLTNFEMETAGYYAMARLLGHEMLSLNAILANRITHQFAQNPSEVVEELIVKVLERA
jgi:uridine phosphorylase